MAPKSTFKIPQSQSHRSAAPTRLSPHWFFPDGDLLLRCGSTLYLVHSKVLSQASGVFRDALRRPTPIAQSSPFGMPMGAGGCRSNCKINPNSRTLLVNQHPSPSLSARLWVHLNQRQRAAGKPVGEWKGGKAMKPPKVLVVEDREANVDYLLYFLYPRGETRITQELLPHILSLGIRYQISVFTNSSLSILRENARSHPCFVIRTLHPFMPPPAAAAAIAPPNMNNFTATITNTYNVAIAALLDDFPRYHASLDPRVKEEYMFSVPIPVQNKCIERWNRYAWDMSFLRSGELFQRPVNKNTTVTASERFSYEHDETCTNSGGRRESCEEKIHIMLLEEWVQWWGRETARRQVPKPTRLRRFLKHVDAHLECLIARETEDGPGWKCAEGVMRELVERLEKVVGPGLWGDGEERFIGLRLDADAPKL